MVYKPLKLYFLFSDIFARKKNQELFYIFQSEQNTHVLIFKSQTSTEFSVTHANTVADLGDHATSYTGFWMKYKVAL